MGKKQFSSNEQRSNSLNPNNRTFRASVENKANQLNPNNEEYKGKEEDKKD